MFPARTTQLDHNIHRHALRLITSLLKIIRKVRAHAKTRRESRIQGSLPILDAAIDIERVGEDDGFWRLDVGRDTLRVVEATHRGHEFEGVAAVLAGAAEDLGVGCGGLRVWVWGGVGVGMGGGRAVVLGRKGTGGPDGWRCVGYCVLGAVAGKGGGSGRRKSGGCAGAGGCVNWGVFAEGFEEGGCAECVGQGD